MKRDEFKNEQDPALEIVNQRNYIQKLEKENENLRKQMASDNALFAAIKGDLKVLPPPEPVDYPRPKLKHAPLFPVLNVADAHAEENVRPEEMEGLAEYTFSIFEDRLLKTGKKTLELVNIQRQASEINTLTVNSLGDWFCGMIHPQDKGYGVSMPMPVAVPKVGIAFGNFLRGLSAHFKTINVNCMCGNHGRDTMKPSLKMTADRNWDVSVYLIAQELTKECGNILWNIPQSIMATVQVAGWGCLLSHSGEVAMTSRTPYYGIERTIQMERNLRYNTNKQFTYCFLGHFHHEFVLDSDCIGCPSMIGDSQFGRYRLHRISRPEQLLCFLTEKHGIISKQPLKL